MKKQAIMKPILVALGTMAISATAYGGSMPKGKPFVELNNQIVEVRGQVQTLDQQVESLIGEMGEVQANVSGLQTGLSALTARVAAIEASIAQLENAKTSIEAQISDLYAKAAANGVNIQTLQTQLVTLEGQVAALEAQGSTNTSEINLLKDQIAAINTTLAQNASGLTSLQANLADTNTKISLLQQQLLLANQELSYKQNLITGKCNTGEFVREVKPDGSVICGTDAGGISGGLEVVTVNKLVTLPAGHYIVTYTESCSGTTCFPISTISWDAPDPQQVSVQCPAGSVVYGGTYSAPNTVSVTNPHIVLGLTNSYILTAVVTGTGFFGQDITLQASCLRVVP